jgi:RecA/RadA recombinase
MVTQAAQALLQGYPEDIQKSAEAALLLQVAATIDNDKTSATALAALAKVLVEVIDRLRALAPSEEQEDELEANRKRLDRRTAA